MKKLKNQGFIIVETLIVAAFVLGIFTFIYVNVIPLIGIYEQRNTYDDIESVYNIDIIRDNLDLSALTLNQIKTSPAFCGTNDLCNDMLAAMEIDYIGLINTNNTNNINGEKPDGLNEYLDYIGTLEEERIIIVKQHKDKYPIDNDNLGGMRTYPIRFANLKQVGGI